MASLSRAGANFWIVVNTIPPAGTFSSSWRLIGLRVISSACWTELARCGRENVSASWLSRSVRSVTATTVGLANLGSRRSLLTKNTIV
jgi:hypothetical protein